MATAVCVPECALDYATAEPFPHAVIDDCFERSRAIAAARELRALRLPELRPVYAQAGKRTLADRSAMPPETGRLIDDMNGPAFVAFLEALTGISGLVADHALFGGGVHQIGRGGFLKIHADFAWHRRLALYRRVNVLLYLNEDWRPEWGGALELWREDMGSCGARIVPSLNRLVVFSTADTSFHGHPEPLACPADVTRNSIALYYYSAEPTAPRGGHCTVTDYRERPGERFRSFRHWRQQVRRRVAALLARSGQFSPSTAPAPASTGPSSAPGRSGRRGNRPGRGPGR